MDIPNPDIKNIEHKRFRHASISLFENHPKVALIVATSSYIPIEDFKEVFHEMEQVVIDRGINKLIFDKRALRVFHQPSMEWYFVEWKEKMRAHGLNSHVKILPTDETFCQSVVLGRREIERKHPNAGFHKLNIIYADSIEAAILG